MERKSGKGKGGVELRRSLVGDPQPLQSPGFKDGLQNILLRDAQLVLEFSERFQT